MIAETDIVVCKTCRRLFVIFNSSITKLKAHAWENHVGYSPDTDDIHERFEFIKGIGYE